MLGELRYYIIADGGQILDCWDVPPTMDDLQSIATSEGDSVSVVEGKDWGFSVEPEPDEDAPD